MTEHPELVCAYLLDGSGRGTPLDWDGVTHWTPKQGEAWFHFDFTQPATEPWFRQHSGLDTHVIDGLLAAETRPRCDWFPEGILIVLRGVNLNPGADPEDMVSIRLWIDDDKVISTRMRKLMAVEDIREQLAVGKGPVSTGHLVARLAARMTERLGPVIDDISDEVVELEDRLLRSGEGDPLPLREARHKLMELRRIAISLRRYVAPQREALNRLSQLEEPWLDERVRGRLRETVDRTTRITEELDDVRERSAVVQDELASRLSHRMERTMYTLTLVATVMLPLGFLTGLLGINVGGIPGADTSWAFWAVCGGLLSVAAFEVWLLKRLRWL
ncbi:zinc transporter ZntB [Magnetospira thiophila]